MVTSDVQWEYSRLTPPMPKYNLPMEMAQPFNVEYASTNARVGLFLKMLVVAFSPRNLE